MKNNTNAPRRLGDWLRQELWNRKLSVRDLSELSGVARATIYAWLTDRNRPDHEGVEAIATALTQEPVYDMKGRKSRRGVSPIEIEQLFTRRSEGRPAKARQS